MRITLFLILANIHYHPHHYHPHDDHLSLWWTGKALVELQVTQVQASAQKKPGNASLALTVHSLLVVDALQSYGQDFELLVASHHNLQ